MTANTVMLAALVHPALFWGGLAAVGVPILIHLLARRRFRRVRWAAMSFLIDAEKRNRRRVRIEELILLALRCLAVFLVGLFIARPFVQPSGIASLLGGAERTERIFLLDDSFSMGYLSEGATSLARAKAGVANLINRLRTHAPGDTVTLLRTSELDAPVVAGALLDDAQIELLLSRLEAIEPSQRALSVAACLGAVERHLERDASTTSAALYILSDFQRIDWVGRRAGEAEDSATPASSLEEWSGTGRGLRVVLVDVGDDTAQNVAVTALAPRQRQVVTGVEASLLAEIGNFTARELPQTELDVSAAQRAAAQVVQHVSAGATTAASIPVTFTQAGDEAVRVEIPPDDLPIDNARWAAVSVSEAVRVLVVNGEPSADAYLDEVALLVAAMRPEGDIFSGNQVDTIDESALEVARLADYHLVMLCNLYRVSEPAADALHAYVGAGGGLMIFPGDQVSDPVLYNATLYRGGKGLLPASFQAVITASAAGVTLGPGDWRHPVVQVFAGEDNPFRDRIRFARYYATEPAVTAEDSDAGGDERRMSSRVLARFDDLEQTPALIERSYGEGRVMLFTSTCDLEWNDWARDPSFVVTMQELVQYLARASAAVRPVRVSEAIRLSLDPSRFDAVATVRGPGYPQEEEIEIAAVAGDGGGLQFLWTQTDRAGIYTFLLRERGGGQVTRRVAVVLDANESDLRPALEDELRPMFGALPVEYVAGVPQRDDDADEGRRELWPGVLILALCVLMGEQFLAWRFGRA